MLDRLSLSTILRSVLAMLAALLVITLLPHGWDAWTRLQNGRQTAEVVGASGDIFTVLAKLRKDRARTAVLLSGAAPATAEQKADITAVRDGELPALRRALAVMHAVPFAGQPATMARLDELADTLQRLHAESWEAAAKPKTERRPELAGESDKAMGALLDLLETAGRTFAATVVGRDAMVDHLLQVKQQLWNFRKATGVASLIVTQSTNAGRLDEATRQRYVASLGAIDAAWAAVQDAASGNDLPPALARDLEAVKSGLLTPEYTSVRDRVVDSLARGEKSELTTVQWLAFTSARLDTPVTAAQTAITEALAHADASNDATFRELVQVLVILAVVILVATGGIVIVNRRVIAPLQSMTHAMQRLADGDLSVEATGAQRRDEIGALAGALATFRANALEKARIEIEQQEARAQRDRRAAEVERAIATFDAEISKHLTGVLTASRHLDGTAREMTTLADDGTRQAADVAASAHQASANVQTVAAASEELARSIEEIGQQVVTSQTIARQAVREAETTNTTVAGLVEASSRVGEIVGLINSIASQTNLLALNATIEAARAGEAGKGFAVVAQEVKNLAAQTAHATEQISQQIQSMQTISSEAAQAIKGIGGTIVRIDEIATGIAAAVEEQNAATREIARNVEQAARGTERVSGAVSGISSAAERSGEAAGRVLGASGEVASQADIIRAEVAEFLGRMRAA